MECEQPNKGRSPVGTMDCAMHNYRIEPYDPLRGQIALGNCALRDPSNIIKVKDTYYFAHTKVRSTDAAYPHGYKGKVFISSSDDLRNWEVSIAPIIDYGEPGAPDEGGCFSPGLYYDEENRRIICTYTGIDSRFPETLVKTIMLAWVSDVTPTSKYIRNGPVLFPGVDGVWDDSTGALDDTCPIEWNGEKRIYYCGGLSSAGGGMKHVGYASAGDWLSAFTKSPANPVLNPNLHGYQGLEAATVNVHEGHLHLLGDGFKGGRATQHLLKFTSRDGVDWAPWGARPAIVTSNQELGSQAGVYAPGLLSERGRLSHMVYHYQTEGAMSLSIARINCV